MLGEIINEKNCRFPYGKIPGFSQFSPNVMRDSSFVDAGVFPKYLACFAY